MSESTSFQSSGGLKVGLLQDAFALYYDENIRQPIYDVSGGWTVLESTVYFLRRKRESF